MASRIINMTIPESLIDEADELAEAEGRTRSELFREALRYYVKEHKNESKNSVSLLSRLAAHAVKGPKLSVKDMDKSVYRKDW